MRDFFWLFQSITASEEEKDLENLILIIDKLFNKQPDVQETRVKKSLLSDLKIVDLFFFYFSPII